MLVLTLILTFLLTRECSGDCHKPNGGCCYPTAPHSKTSACPALEFSRDDVRWSVEASGRLNFSFTLPREKHITCLKLVLLVDETMSEEECNAQPRTKEILLDKEFKHSRRWYTIEQNCLPGTAGYQPPCEANGLMSFNYVFSGCYQMAFKAIIDLSTCYTVHSPVRYLNTNYIKKIIAGPQDENVPWFTVTDQYNHKLEKLKITFTVDEHISSSYKTYLNKERDWVVNCNNTARKCWSTDKDPPKSPSHQHQYPLAKCDVENEYIMCIFEKVVPGNYSFTVNIESEDRCDSETLWTKSKHCPQNNRSCSLLCRWQHNFTAEGKATLEPQPSEGPPSSSYFYPILATLVAVVVVGTTVFLVVLRAYGKRYNSGTPLTLPASSAIPMESSRIFLLYARDCQPFMKLMATLREVLEGATKSEVIDCLDDSRWNDIGRSPVEWVRSHIEHPTTKVILVATPCGNLRQQAHLNQTVTYYKKPENYDNLFTYGLKTLTDNLSQDVYRKICVIRFEGFSDDGNLFSHLTPYTRFVLPLHLRQLILTLQPSVTADEEDVHLVESKEVQNLCQNLTNLINYKNTNINYLQDMLIVQRNNAK